MPDEVAGYGTSIGYADTAEGSYTTLADVVDITPPEEEVDDIETTTHSSTNKVRTYQGGLIEPGETDVVIQFDKTIYGTLRGLRGAKKFWKITIPDGSTQVFAGYIKKIGPETPLDDIVTVNLTMMVAGDPTYRAATSPPPPRVEVNRLNSNVIGSLPRRQRDKV
jgi:hypothetical protein